jgi:hypothetical protein
MEDKRSYFWNALTVIAFLLLVLQITIKLRNRSNERKEPIILKENVTIKTASGWLRCHETGLVIIWDSSGKDIAHFYLDTSVFKLK